MTINVVWLDCIYFVLFILYQGSVDHYNVFLIQNRMQVMESFLNTILIWEMYVLHILWFIVYEIIIDLCD